MAAAGISVHEAGFLGEWNINDSELVNGGDPEKIYKEYNHLRSQCPVAHVDKHNGYWVLTKYESIPKTP